MATLIICPACDTRYQIKAAFPPEGRKVRCAKCAHVWQARPAGAEPPVQPPRAAPPPPQAAPPAPTQPEPSPQAAPPAPPELVPAPQAAPPAPPELVPAPQAAPPPPAPPQAAPPVLPTPVPAPPRMPPRADAEFGSDEAVAEPGFPEPAGAPPPEPAKKGGLFGKLMGKRGKPASPSPSSDVAPPAEDAAFGAPGGAAFGIPEGAPPPALQDASFDAGGLEAGTQDSALADPDLVAAAFGESVSKQNKVRKGLPIVAIGWGILALIVLTVVGLFVFAPSTTVSILPGASRIYAMLGMPVGTEGLAFEGVRYGWTDTGGKTVLEVQGNVRNTGSAAMAVPTVVIALRDENGQEISEWTTEVGAAELAAQEEAPFLLQIPSPPSNVRSLKVRFANADD